METSFIIYRTGNNWYRTKGEAGDYDEKVFVEVPGYTVPINLSLDTLVELHTKYHWGKHGSFGIY